MAEGFWGGLHRHLIFWSGWAFTVGGAAASLWMSKEYAWVGIFLVVTGLVALTAFAYQKHQDLQGATTEHRARTSQLETDFRAVRDRAETAERRLNEVPANILARLQATIQAHAFEELTSALAKHADYVARMVSLHALLTRPITLRTFVKRAGGLFVDAKLAPAAIAHLRQDDPFLLEFKSSAGLVTASALLRVHQLEAPKELVWFRVATFRGAEVAHIDALAETQEVPGKGYTARPVCDPARYANRNLADAVALIRTLTDDLIRLRE